jgi:acyl-CoA dehydrogenase
MMEELARERLTVGISAVATAEGAIENTVIYTTEREAFKIQIAGFQNTQFKLAECATQVQIHQVDRCIALLVEHKLTETASMIKYSATDMVDECLQLFGGYMWIIQFQECMLTIVLPDLCWN